MSVMVWKILIGLLILWVALVMVETLTLAVQVTAIAAVIVVFLSFVDRVGDWLNRWIHGEDGNDG